MENLTGKQLGPYRVTAPLGEGGMAAVYKAYHASMDRYVAIKVLPQQLANDPAFVGRFRQEAQLLAKLQHPHILPVFDFGESEGYTYIAMPFVESGTLTDLLTGRPLAPAQIREIGSQVGDALDYAHSLGLVHRDVKPSNVLVDKRGNCLLTDFGIAKMIEGAAKFTNTGGIVGTPAYMSPEQGRGDKVDIRTDIYSLGIMLYEMTVGRVPFDAETPIAIVFKHISDPLPLPSQIVPSVPDALERVILKALAKDPNERFATAGDMVRALKAALPDHGPAAEPLAPPTQSAPPRANTVVPHVGGVPTAVQPPEASRPAEKKKFPIWLLASGGLLLVCVCLVIVGVVARSFTNRNNNNRRTATPDPAVASNLTPSATEPKVTPSATAPEPTTPAVSLPGFNAVEILKAGPSADTLNTAASFDVVVQYTLAEPKGVLEVWMSPYTDPTCETQDMPAGTHETVYYNAVELEQSSGEVTLNLSGPPTGYKYLAVDARLADETYTNILAADNSGQWCLEITQPVANASVFTKTPPVLDGTVTAGEWDTAGRIRNLPHGVLLALNDGDFLYLLIDLSGDTQADPPLREDPWGDYFAIYVDVNENAVIDPNLDVAYGMAGDIFGLTQVLGPLTTTGIDTNIEQPSKKADGFGATSASVTAHRFWEVALLLKEMQAAPGEEVRIGITAYSQSPSFLDEVPVGQAGDFSSLIAFTLGN